jgi:hypothetical protein
MLKFFEGEAPVFLSAPPPKAKRTKRIEIPPSARREHSMRSFQSISATGRGNKESQAKKRSRN